MSNSKLVALLIAIGMVAWVLSGDFSADGITADDSRPAQAQDATSGEVPLVRGIRSVAVERSVYLDVRGQTRANRRVDVKAEVSGVVEQVPGVRGKQVKTGDLLCEIAIDSRRSNLSEAVANLKSAQLEYDGILDLNQQGLQSQINLARAKATLEQMRSAAKRAELALQKTRILAPFDGVVENQPVEIGDFLSPGATCVTLLEIDPILVVGRVAERNIAKIQLGDTVKAQLITGQEYDATVTFIGRAPEAVTRTYEVEATIADPASDIRAGLTASMRVPTGIESAHLISSASMVLNDAGDIGVRIVDTDNRVRFMPVNVVSEGPDGVWVSGLPEESSVITVGQEGVFEGQVVQVDFSALSALVSY